MHQWSKIRKIMEVDNICINMYVYTEINLEFSV